MKCPFRTKTVNINIVDNNEHKTVINEEYEECYGEECPYYQPEGHIPTPTGDVKFKENCKRI